MVGYHGVSHITIAILCEFSFILRALRDLMFFIDMANYRACHPSSQGMLCSLGGTSNSCCSYQNLFFCPTCLARVVRFYVSRPPPPPPPPPDLNYLNCKLVIAVVPIRVGL